MGKNPFLCTVEQIDPNNIYPKLLDGTYEPPPEPKNPFLCTVEQIDPNHIYQSLLDGTYIEEDEIPKSHYKFFFVPTKDPALVNKATYEILHSYGSETVDYYIGQVDTWKIKRESRIHSILTNMYKARYDYLEIAARQANEIFQYIRPASSRTRKNGLKFHFRCLKWMFDHYDAGKFKSLQREEDIQRMSYMEGVKNLRILAHIFTHKFHLSYKETSAAISIFEYLVSHFGRMSYKIKRKLLKQAPTLKDKFTKVFKLLREYKRKSPGQKRGTCRQWGLNQDVVQEYKDLKEKVGALEKLLYEKIAELDRMALDEDAIVRATLGADYVLFYDICNLFELFCRNFDKS